MEVKFMLKMQRVLSYSLMVIAVFTFVLGLGFMTNFYPLFYEGTTEMFALFKDLQVLNRAMFNAAIIFVLIFFLLIPFDINKKEAGIFSLLYVLGTTVYIVLTSNMIVSAIPYYKKMYLALDFSGMKQYQPSIFPFTIGTVLFVMIMVLASLLLIIVIVNYVSRIKRKRSVGGTYAKS